VLDAAPPPVPPRYATVAEDYGPALGRLVRGYEADPDRQRDLLQDIHLALWRSLPTFDGRASLRTWVYRVAHNVAVTHVLKSARHRPERLLPIESFEEACSAGDAVLHTEQRDAVARLATLVRQLRPGDRQVILLYLEGFDHAEIAEMAGISPENAATKVHRIKRVLQGALARGSEDHAAR